MKWWQKGIILSILWVGFMVAIALLAGGADSDEIAQRSGILCGLVLGGGWLFAILSRLLTVKWWQKGIILSILWVAPLIGIMFLDGAAKNDQIAERYGRICGMVLVGGWFFAVLSHILPARISNHRRRHTQRLKTT